MGAARCTTTRAQLTDPTDFVGTASSDLNDSPDVSGSRPNQADTAESRRPALPMPTASGTKRPAVARARPVCGPASHRPAAHRRVTRLVGNPNGLRLAKPLGQTRSSRAS